MVHGSLRLHGNRLIVEEWIATKSEDGLYVIAAYDPSKHVWIDSNRLEATSLDILPIPVEDERDGDSDGDSDETGGSAC